MLVSGSAFSQGLISGVMERLEFGLKAGANYSDFVDAPFATDPLTGYHAGGTLNFRLSKQLSIQEDILYSLQGARSKSILSEKEDIKLHYITVPILLRFKTRFGLYVEAGAQAAMLINEDVPASAGYEKFAEKLDASAVGGIGFHSKSGVGLGLRYVYGFTKVGNKNNALVRPDFTSSTAQASIFYTF